MNSSLSGDAAGDKLAVEDQPAEQPFALPPAQTTHSGNNRRTHYDPPAPWDSSQ